MPQKPTRKPTPQVYRRRRLVVLLLTAGLIAAGAWGVATAIGATGGQGAAPVAATPAPSETTATSPAAAAPAATPAATPAPTPTSTAPAKCTSHSVSVRAVTDADSYAAGVQPQFSLVLKNETAQPCVIDVGSAAIVYAVTSGSDRVWTSTDCQTEPAHSEAVLEAGREIAAPAIPWVRERSSTSTCQGERPAAVAGGAYYHLTASVDGIQSEPVAFVLQ